MDDAGTLKHICDDKDIIGLSNQLRKQQTTCIYINFSGVKHGKRTPQTLLLDFESDVGLYVRKVDEIDSGDDSSEDDKERLQHVPFINYSSNIDQDSEEQGFR